MPHCTSRHTETAEEFAKGILVFKIQTKSGRLIANVSGFESEQEVVGMPSKYRVVKLLSPAESKKLGVKRAFELEQVESLYEKD